MNKKANVFGMLCLGISMVGFAQQLPLAIETDSTQVQQLEEIVITDSKFKLKRENSGKVITKITQATLQHQQGKSVAEIINATAGIEINGTKSNAGQNLNYYVRGGRNRQVLVLIDGVALTDASQIANDFDLRLLNVDQIDSIEILKGASSTLYGSGAATVVINIKLKEASKKAISSTFRSVLGSNQSQNDSHYHVEDFRNSVSVNGTIKDFTYLASFGNQFTDGLSSLSSIETDKDAFNTINGSLKLGCQFSNVFKLNLYGSFDDFKADFDDTFSGADMMDMSETNQYRFGMTSEFYYNKGSLTLNAAYNRTKRTISSSYPAIYKAESIVGDGYNRYKFNANIYTVLGLNVQQNNMESFAIPYGSSNLEQSINPDIAEFTMMDPYANAVYQSDFGLNLNVGIRLNNHSEYGSHLVYSLNPSFKKTVNFGYIKGMASFSTAYITPSLYQLFEPSYGNKALQPEENTTLEFGTEIDFKDKATLSLVYFTRTEINFIDFVDVGNFVYQYNNVDDSFTASGLEFTANYKLSKTISCNANATYTHVEDPLNLRIPKFKLNASLLYNLTSKTFLSVSFQFNDDRNDAVFNNDTFSTDKITLDGYKLFELYLSHKLINNKVMLFANLTNIFNEDYQELFGYTTRGRNVSLGLNIVL